MNFEKGTKIKHYKGGQYTVIGIATESETADEVVVYQNDIDKKIWVRPIDMFFEEVRFKGRWVKRFEVIEGDSE